MSDIFDDFFGSFGSAVPLTLPQIILRIQDPDPDIRIQAVTILDNRRELFLIDDRCKHLKVLKHQLVKKLTRSK
jgi:hypothetical protein